MKKTYYACFKDFEFKFERSFYHVFEVYQIDDRNILLNNISERSSHKSYFIEFESEMITNPFLLTFINHENEKYFIAEYNGSTFSKLLECEQTREKCLKVVREDGLNLRYVKNQTVEICLAAMANNPEGEKYVKIELNVDLDYLLNSIDNLGSVNSDCTDIL